MALRVLRHHHQASPGKRRSLPHLDPIPSRVDAGTALPMLGAGPFFAPNRTGHSVCIGAVPYDVGCDWRTYSCVRVARVALCDCFLCLTAVRCRRRHCRRRRRTQLPSRPGTGREPPWHRYRGPALSGQSILSPGCRIVPATNGPPDTSRTDGDTRSATGDCWHLDLLVSNWHAGKSEKPTVAMVRKPRA